LKHINVSKLQQEIPWLDERYANILGGACSESGMFNRLFGPSIYLLILDMFLDNPDELTNLREIARRVDKNPGSISRVIPRLVEEGFLEQIQVGRVVVAYRLNTENELVRLLLDFREKLQKLQEEQSKVMRPDG